MHFFPAILRKQCVNKLFEFTHFRDLSVFEVQCYYIISENSELCIIFSNLFLVNVTNLYIQKEHFTLLDKDGKPSMFALVMIAPLSTCAHL